LFGLVLEEVSWVLLGPRGREFWGVAGIQRHSHGA
jgi:hypothetical protein